MSNFKNNIIYNLDVFVYLETVPNNYIDLAVIDPPYNMSKGNWDTFKSHDDFLNFTYKWIDLLIPKLKESVYIFNTPFN